MVEILNCPFCGNANPFLEGSPGLRHVTCNNDMCQASIMPEDSDAKAIAAWNRRAPAPAESGAVAWMTADGRIATDETKRTAMASPSRAAFNIPLFPHPSPAPSASMGRVTVKALEWFSLDTPFYSKAETIVGRYLANRNALLWYLWLPGQSPETHSPIIHDNYDDHRYAAQAHHDALILGRIDYHEPSPGDTQPALPSTAETQAPPDHGGGEGE